MALTPLSVDISNEVYTRVVNNQTEYLVQNSGSSMIYIVGSDSDLGATTATDLGGYKIIPMNAVDNAQLKEYPYVYAKSVAKDGKVDV